MRRTALVLTFAVLAMLLVAVPALAATTSTSRIGGIEISAGTVVGQNRLGATFVGAARGDLPGTLQVTLRYVPPNPGPGVTNEIVGGLWSLQVIEDGKLVGTLSGTVAGGQAVWNSSGTQADIQANLVIRHGTGAYSGKTGSGSFAGTLSHETYPPTWRGTLRLTL